MCVYTHTHTHTHTHTQTHTTSSYKQSKKYKSSQPASMFPVCQKMKTTHGPHATCLMTAETFWMTFRHRHSHHLQIISASRCNCRLLAGHAEATIFLCSYLLTSALFFFFAICSLVGYVGVRLCLRFQLKLALYLIMLRRVPFEFKLMNNVCLCCLHLSLFSTGGLGLLVLSFVDT